MDGGERKRLRTMALNSTGHPALPPSNPLHPPPYPTHPPPAYERPRTRLPPQSNTRLPQTIAMSPQSSYACTPAVIIHGGAGNITHESLPPPAYTEFKEALLALRHKTVTSLEAGVDALTAACATVQSLENNTLFNCGKGAVFTRAGTIELEASVMVSRGFRKRGVGVTMLGKVKNPILLAKEVLVRGESDGAVVGKYGETDDPSGGSGGAQGHVQLSGETAEGLARGWGLEMCEPSEFWTRKRWEEHERGLEREKAALSEAAEVVTTKSTSPDASPKTWIQTNGDPSWDGKTYLPQGTVGCVVLDRYGTLCVATSTGGLTNKLPGRIGDTPTLGAGFWAEEWEASVQSPALVHQLQTLTTSRPQFPMLSPLAAFLPTSLRDTVAKCMPSSLALTPTPTAPSTPPNDEKATFAIPRAAAISGTGNGDSFLRLCAARTACAIVRYSSYNQRTLASAVRQVVGKDGDLQKSAGDRWGVTGEGEGGMVGIEMVPRQGGGSQGDVVWDLNCGGMFRAWWNGIHGEEGYGVFAGEGR